MGKKPKEKHILILIEGSSEQTIFEMSLPEMFDAIGDDYNVHFAFICEDGNDVRGDISSKHGVTPDKIEGLISKLYVGHVLEVDKFYARDISEIIHIIDLDGAYIPNENIVQGDNPNGEDKPFYTESTIINRSVSSIEERNKRKRDNIAALLTLPKGRIRVWHNPDNPKSKQSTIPYSLYYFSTNLDHFIHNDANLPSTGRAKVNLAEVFANGFIDDLDGFISFFVDDPASAGEMTYEESWNFIRQPGIASLQRHTNIDILLKRLQAMADEQ